MTLSHASRLTFSSPAALRIRASEIRAMERLAREAAQPAPANLIPPPDDGPLYEGTPDSPLPAQSVIPHWWAGADDLLPKYPSVATIQKAACAYFRFPMKDLIGPRRHAPLVWARMVACHLARELTPLSLPQIGRRFGGRDHTTVLSASRVVAAKIAADVEKAEQVGAVRRMVMFGAECGPVNCGDAEQQNEVQTAPVTDTHPAGAEDEAFGNSRSAA